MIRTLAYNSDVASKEIRFACVEPIPSSLEVEKEKMDKHQFDGRTTRHKK